MISKKKKVANPPIMFEEFVIVMIKVEAKKSQRPIKT